MMNASEKNDLPDFMQPGWEAEIGSHTFAADEIIAFAKDYDPQPFHMDEELAKKSLFGGLCASGWHTASMWMRKQRDHAGAAILARKKAGLPLPEFGPSPGFKNLRWHKPVFAGDAVTYFNATISIRESESRPGWYILSTRQSAKNQNEELVLSFESSVFVKYPT